MRGTVAVRLGAAWAEREGAVKCSITGNKEAKDVSGLEEFAEDQTG